MKVVCKVNCPYNDRGFCARGLTAIDEMGMCEMWWDKGQQRASTEVQTKNPLYKEKITILTMQKSESEALASPSPKNEVKDEETRGIAEDSRCDGADSKDSSEESEAE